SEGILLQDQHIAGYARDAGKGLLLAVNKWDLLPREDREDQSWRARLRKAFQFLPEAPIVYISATAARNVRDVLPAALAVAGARSVRVPTGELNRLVRD